MPSDGNKTKELITKTAIALFQNKGYNNVSVQDICEQANIKRATFYYHFKTKDAILDTFYDDIVIPPEFSSKIITTDNCWMKLWLIVKSSIDWTITMGSEILSTIFIMNFQNGGQTFFPIHEDYTKTTIMDIIVKGQHEGQFLNTSSPLEIYHNFRNIIIGIAAVWCMKQGSFDEEDEIHRSLSQLLQARSELVQEEVDWLKEHF